MIWEEDRIDCSDQGQGSIRQMFLLLVDQPFFSPSSLCFPMLVLHPYTSSLPLSYPCYLPNKKSAKTYIFSTGPSFPISIPRFGISDTVTKVISVLHGITNGVTWVSPPKKLADAPFEIWSSLEYLHLNGLCDLATPHGAICNFYQILTLLFIMCSLFSCQVQMFLRVCSLS